MTLILWNLFLGMAQALLLTFLAPLLAGLILQAGTILRQWIGGANRKTAAWYGRSPCAAREAVKRDLLRNTLPEEEKPVPALTVSGIFTLLARAWESRNGEARMAFFCTFLASAMLPGFLGAKISFGDSFIMFLLFGASLFFTQDHYRETVTALFLLTASAGFQHRGTMNTDLVFSFSGYYLTGAAVLAAVGALCLAVLQLSSLEQELAEEKHTAGGKPIRGSGMGWWLLLTGFLQAAFLLIVFAGFFLPLKLPLGPGVLLTAAVCALMLGMERLFHADRRQLYGRAGVLFALLSLLAR